MQAAADEEEGTWETVWVSGNGSEIRLDEEVEVPDEAPDTGVSSA